MCCAWAVTEGPGAKVILGRSPEGSKRLSRERKCRWRIPGRGQTQCKGPEGGTRLPEEVREVLGARPGDQAAVGFLASTLGEMGAGEDWGPRSDTGLTFSLTRPPQVLC